MVNLISDTLRTHKKNTLKERIKTEYSQPNTLGLIRNGESFLACQAEGRKTEQIDEFWSLSDFRLWARQTGRGSVQSAKAEQPDEHENKMRELNLEARAK